VAFCAIEMSTILPLCRNGQTVDATLVSDYGILRALAIILRLAPVLFINSMTSSFSGFRTVQFKRRVLSP
jgi:hypothetical protein